MIHLKNILLETQKEKELTFVRYGGLSPVKQVGYDSGMKTMHSPPARHGIYAFVKGAEERFLMGGGQGGFSGLNTQNPKWQFIRDKDGNKIEYNDKKFTHHHKQYGEYGKDWTNRNVSTYTDEKAGKTYFVKLIKPKFFKHSGNIWHHLKGYVNPGEILAEKGSWVLTSSDAHRDAFYKAHADFKRKNYAFDELEVFIERVK